jgi:hypothetical protein
MRFRFSHSRPLSYLILSIALSMFPLVASATQYQPGQTLNPSCPPSDATCIVVPSTASTNISASFQATSTTAASTFAGSTSVAGTASSTNVVVSSSLTIGSLNGILKAVAGVVTSALVNLSSDVTGILGVTNGGTGTSATPTYGQVLVGNGSGGYMLTATSSLGIAGGGSSPWVISGSNISYASGNVGIGTTSPTALVTVDPTSTTGTILRVSNGDVGGHIFDLLSTGSANTNGAGRLDFFDKTAGLSRLSITSSGNIGIGTTSPSQVLSVQGNGLFSGNVMVSAGASSTPSLVVGDAGGLYRYATGVIGVSNGMLVNSPVRVGSGYAAAPSVDFEIRSTINPGYAEARVAQDTANFTAWYYHNQQAFMEVWTQTGASTFDISPKPTDGISNAFVSVARNTITSGNVAFDIYKGDATSALNTHLSGNSSSYLNALSGSVAIGTSTPMAALTVEGSTDEIQRLIRNTPTLGLSFGYNEGGGTTAYLYNRYSSNSASAIKLGFGSTYASGQAFNYP